jgi:hypothetical protein
MRTGGNGVPAGPCTTAPVLASNTEPWHGQKIFPLDTLFTVQPACVHEDEKACTTLPDGRVMTTPEVINPPPIEMALSRASSVRPRGIAPWPYPEAVDGAVATSLVRPYAKPATAPARTVAVAVNADRRVTVELI